MKIPGIGLNLSMPGIFLILATISNPAFHSGMNSGIPEVIARLPGRIVIYSHNQNRSMI